MPFSLSKYVTIDTSMYRILIFSSLSALLTLCLASYIDASQQQQKAALMANKYGESIAKLTADQVVTSTLNNDAISLQAIAYSTINNAAATSVIIYDINNNILAQANTSDTTIHQQHTIQHHTSPIVSSNNIIGSVTIGIAPSVFTVVSKHYFYLSLAFVLLLVIILSYLKIKTQTKLHNTTENNKPFFQDDITPNTEILNPTIEEQKNNVYLTFKIQNINIFYQQLNAELRQQQFEKLEKDINHAINFYGGDILFVTNDNITLRFNKRDDDHIFNALYTGKMVLQLNQLSSTSIIIINGYLQTDTIIEPLHRSLDNIRKCVSSDNKENELFIHQTLFDEYDFNSRTSYENTTPPSNWLKVDDFKGHYKTLLENQLKKLQKIPDNIEK